MLNSLINNVLIQEAVTAARYTIGTTDPAPSAFETIGCDEVACWVSGGTVGSTLVTVTLTECATEGGTYTTMAGDCTIATFSADGSAVVVYGVPLLPWVKVSISGTNAAMDTLSAVYFGINPVHAPVADTWTNGVIT